MKFQPKTQEEIDAMSLLPEGVYDFVVLDACESVSKKGNDMIKLTLNVYDDRGAVWRIFDYIMEAFPRKLRHFCEALSLDHEYATGTLEADMCLDKAGRVKIKIAPAGEYPARNEVVDYLPPLVDTNGAKKQESGQTIEPQTDYDMPF